MPNELIETFSFRFFSFITNRKQQNVTWHWSYRHASLTSAVHFLTARTPFFDGKNPFSGKWNTPEFLHYLNLTSTRWRLKVRFLHMYGTIYINVTSVCIFVGCWPWSIRGHTHRWRESTSALLFFFFDDPKSSDKPFEFLLYKTNIDYIFSCVCIVINHRRRHSL